MRCRGGGGVARRKGCGARWGNPNQSRTQSPGPVRRAGGKTLSCCEFPQRPGLLEFLTVFAVVFPRLRQSSASLPGERLSLAMNSPNDLGLLEVLSVFAVVFPRLRQSSASLPGERFSLAVISPNDLGLLEFLTVFVVVSPITQQSSASLPGERLSLAVISPNNPRLLEFLSVFVDTCPSAAAGGRGKRTDSVHNLHSSAVDPA